MGKLLDEKYWGRVLSRVDERRPINRQVVMPREDCVVILEEACRAFTDLVEDPDFEADLQSAAQAGLAAMDNIPAEIGPFTDFVRELADVERRTFRQAAVEEEATIRIVGELTGLLRDIRKDDFEGVSEKIRAVQKTVCHYARDPDYRGDPRPDLIADVARATAGISAAGLDLAAIAKSGPVAGALIGNSIGAGYVMCRPLIRRIF